MDKVLIAGGGIAGPVTAMALQRAGLRAVVYEAHVPGERGGRVLPHRGQQRPRRPGGHRRRRAGARRRLPDPGQRAPEQRRAPAGDGQQRRPAGRQDGEPHRQAGPPVPGAARRGGRPRVVSSTAAGWSGPRPPPAAAWPSPSTTAPGPPATCSSAPTAHSVTRRLIDPNAPGGRYVGLVNFGGYTPAPAPAPLAEPGAWHMIFGRRAFFGYVADPGGGTVWFANVPRPAVGAAEQAATSAGQWRRRLVELFAADHGRRPDRRRPPRAGRRQHPRPALGADLAPGPDGDRRRRRPRPAPRARVPPWPPRTHSCSPSACATGRPSPRRWPPTRDCAAAGWSASSPRGAHRQHEDPGRIGRVVPGPAAGLQAARHRAVDSLDLRPPHRLGHPRGRPGLGPARAGAGRRRPRRRSPPRRQAGRWPRRASARTRRMWRTQAWRRSST